VKKVIRLGKLEGTLLISFLTLFCFALLYVCRSFDTNTLTSWQWVFGDGGFIKILPFLLSVIVLSLVISRQIPLEKHPVPVLAIIAGASVLPLWSAPELMLDSGRYFLQAKSLSEYGVVYFIREWGHTVTAWTDLPLIPFLYGLALKYGNESRIAVQLFNTIIFILTVVLTYKIGSSLWDKELGFYAGLLLVGMPYLLTQVPQMLVDIHAMFFHLLAVYCFLEALRSTNCSTLFLSSVTLVLALLVKYSIWPMLAILPLSIFVIYPKDDRQALLKRSALIILGAALTSLIIISFKFNVFSEQIEILLNYQRPALQLWSEGFVSSFSFQSHPFIALLALYSVYRAYQLRDKRFLFILFYCLLIGILQIQRIRYTIPLLPFITLMAAYGLVAIKEIQLRRFAGCVIVSSSLVILFAVYLPFFYTTSMMNIKRAGEYINNLGGELAEVHVQPQEKSEGSTFTAIPLLDMFTDKKIISRQRWPNTKPEHLSPYSPLLFTWKQNKPSYYGEDKDQTQSPHPLVIISANLSGNDRDDKFHTTAPLAKAKHFMHQSGIFRYRTFVSVYN
jgi:4-amino-4-deoxy-L-arabinose transferase-like glycosyltransferase